MINPLYISSVLSRKGFRVDYINGVNTGAIHIHKFKISKDGATDIVTVKKAKVMGEKIFIQTQNGIQYLGEKIARELEELILFAINMTPENKLRYLFRPIYCLSENFPDLTCFSFDEDIVEKEFQQEFIAMDLRRKKEEPSFFTLTFPKNNQSQIIQKLFENLGVVHSIFEQKKKVIVRFFSLINGENEAEMTIFQGIQKRLNEIGIFVEVSDIMEL